MQTLSLCMHHVRMQCYRAVGFSRMPAPTAIGVVHMEAEVVTQAGISEDCGGGNAERLDHGVLCCFGGCGRQRQHSPTWNIFAQHAPQPKVC